jgi:hypothetical protein
MRAYLFDEDRQRRHGHGEEDASRQVLDDEVGAGGEHDVGQERRGQHHHRRRLEHEPVGPLGNDVLLLEELEPVSEELEQAAGAGLLGTHAALHPRHHLEQEDDAEDERRGRHEDGSDQDLDQGLLPVGELNGEDELVHRSMSPRMK